MADSDEEEIDEEDSNDKESDYEDMPPLVDPNLSNSDDEESDEEEDDDDNFFGPGGKIVITEPHVSFDVSELSSPRAVSST